MGTAIGIFLLAISIICTNVSILFLIKTINKLSVRVDRLELLKKYEINEMNDENDR